MTSTEQKGQKQLQADIIRSTGNMDVDRYGSQNFERKLYTNDFKDKP